MDLKRLINAAKEYAELYGNVGLCGFGTDTSGNPEIQLLEEVFVDEFGKRPIKNIYGNSVYEITVDGVRIFALTEKGGREK